jgi:hypothetical protein
MSSVPCIIQSINLKPVFDAGWDINRDKDGKIIKEEPTVKGDPNPYIGQLPKMIDVDMSIIPLHNFVPQLNKPFIGNNKHIVPDSVLFSKSTEEEPIEQPTIDLPILEVVANAN